jgi:putative transposon-encoded protein
MMNYMHRREHEMKITKHKKEMKQHEVETPLEIENDVKAFGKTGAHVGVPRAWIGRRVKIILLTSIIFASLLTTITLQQTSLVLAAEESDGNSNSDNNNGPTDSGPAITQKEINHPETIHIKGQNKCQTLDGFSPDEPCGHHSKKHPHNVDVPCNAATTSGQGCTTMQTVPNPPFPKSDPPNKQSNKIVQEDTTIKTPSIVVDTSPSLLPTTLKVSNVTLVLNSTDSHYHVIGIITNSLHETMDNQLVTVYFSDKDTGAQLRTVSHYYSGPLDPGQSGRFNVDTNYTVNQVGQFKFMSMRVHAN